MPISENARAVLERRYLAKDEAGQPTETVDGLFHRVANAIAARLVAGGVKGIWNFTNIELRLDSTGVIIEDVHFADSLLSLSYMISEEP